LERPANLKLDQWVDLARDSRRTPPAGIAVSKEEWAKRPESVGRSCYLIVDHLEFYRPAQAQTTLKYIPTPRYPLAPEGQKRFVAEVEALRKSRKDLIIFSGWEALETDVDTGLEWSAMEMVDCIGWHMDKPPDAGHYVQRAKQIRDVQRKLEKPVILYHPFRQPTPQPDETVATLRRLGREHQKQLIDILGDSSVYLEINLSVLLQYWPKPARRQAMIEDFQPLAEAGLEFTVGSDAHRIPDIEYHEPERYLPELGIHPRQVTSIVGDLLARARAEAIPWQLRNTLR